MNIDPIIGQWQIEKVTYFYSDASSRSNIPVKCSSSKIFSYKADGTFEFYSFELNNETEACTIPSNDFWEGTWKKSDDGNYIRSLTYKYNSKVRSHYVDSVGKFLFSDDHNKMTQILNYKKSGIAIDDKSGLTEERTLFRRVQ